jgi:hypothetical protein
MVDDDSDELAFIIIIILLCCLGLSLHGGVQLCVYYHQRLLSGTAMKKVNWYLYVHPPEPSAVDGHEPASPAGSWVAVLGYAVVPERWLYHLQKSLFLVGQGFGGSCDLKTFVPWLHLIFLNSQCVFYALYGLEKLRLWNINQ